MNNVGATSTPISTGLATPVQVALDAAGAFYVADNSLGKVLKYEANGSGPTQVGDDVPGLSSLAFDAAGVLHVASLADGTIRKLNGNTFQIFVTLTGPVGARSIAFAADGDLYVADNAGNSVRQVTPQGAQSIFSNDTTAPFAIAFEQGGKVPYVTDTEAGGRIATFNPNGNKSRDVATNLGILRGLAFDKAGTAHYLTADGELRKVTGAETTLVAAGLGDPQMLTAAATVTSVIAFKGQSLTQPEGTTFATVGSPAIGDSRVAFKATLLPPNGSVSAANALGIWRTASDGTIELIARKGFVAPGMAIPDQISPTIQNLADPVLNSSGSIAFSATLRAGLGGVTTANSAAVFSDFDGGALRPIFRKGDAAPGDGLDPAAKFAAFKQLVLPDDAGPAVLATIVGPGITAANNLGLWSRNSAGEISLVMRKGDVISVGGKDRTLAGMGLFAPTVLSRGQARHFGDGQRFTFLAKFTDGFQAILRAEAGQPPVVITFKGAEVGAAIPDARFALLGSPAMQDGSDTVAVFNRLLPPFGGVTTASAKGIFLFDPTAEVLARSSFSAPGVTDAFFANFSDPVLSRDGDIAFFGKMRPGFGGVLASTSAGLWQDTGDGVSLAVRQGAPAAGVPDVTRFTSFKQYVLPSTGGVVFTAAIAGNKITTANNFGLWAADEAGGLELLLRKGDSVEIGGKKRVVTKINVLTAALGVTGHSRHFDEAGTVACQVVCSDGTQAILTLRRP